MSDEDHPEALVRQNYRVVLKGVVFTEVDVIAASHDEAMEKAGTWARGKSQPEEVNAIDFDGYAWVAYESDIADDQSVVTVSETR